MKTTVSCVFLPLALCAAPWSPFPAQRAADPSAKCRECDDTGVVLCPEHPAHEALMEAGVLYCSEVAACPACAGTGRVDCGSCEVPESPELTRKRAGMSVVAKGLADIERVMGRPVRVAESRHFVVVCELPKMKAEKVKRSSHELLHLYVERLEALHEDYRKTFGLSDEDFDHKARVFLWSSQDDHERASRELCGTVSTAPTYRRGVESAFSLCAGERPLEDDESIHRVVVHHVAHAIMNLQKPAEFTATVKAGWADAGIAHWFMDRRFGASDVFCYPGGPLDSGFKPGRWRRGVRMLVARDRVPPLLELVQLDTQELSREQHALAFSLIDYLVSRDAAALDQLLRLLRSRTPTRDAVPAVYGENLQDLELAWKAWVMSEYPMR